MEDKFTTIEKKIIIDYSAILKEISQIGNFHFHYQTSMKISNK